MALTKAQVREILSAAGVDADHMKDAVDRIIDGHAATVAALKEETEGYKAEAEKLAGVQKELDDLKATVAADAKEREGKDYDKLLTEYTEYKNGQEAIAKKTRATEKFRALLTDMNVGDKGIEKILKWQGVDGVELDDEGNITNAKELRKAIKEDWSEYIVTENTKGAETNNPPANNGGSGKTKEEIMAITDATERQKAIAENPEVFGIK